MMAKEIKKELTYNLTYKEVVDILQIMNESTNCRELHLELEDLKLTIIRQENSPPGKPAGHSKVEPSNVIFQEASGIVCRKISIGWDFLSGIGAGGSSFCRSRK
jgi:hypothetical protein